MGAENIIRVLRAKIKGLQNEIEALQVDRNKRVSHKFRKSCLGHLSKCKFNNYLAQSVQQQA
jgi:hypothetical protein